MALHTRLSMLAIGALAATTATAQHVLLPFSQHTGNDDISLSARASKQTTLKSSEYAYVIDATIGTPPQKVSLLISTSSGETWVPDANTRECSPEWYYRNRYGYDDEDFEYLSVPEPRCTWGSFNKSLSSTYLPPNSRYDHFDASYVDTSSVSGYNMTDKLVFGGLEFDDYPMGLVSSAYRWIGMLGLGPNNSASYYSSSSAGTYANIVDRMVSSGKIASPAYSIWLDDAQGTSGGLLFGAVDRSRYTGDLVRVSASGSHSSYYAYGSVTTLNSINGTTASGDAMPTIRSNDFPVDVTVGPGEVFSYLPSRLADQIAEMAGATYDETAEAFMIPCDAGKTNSTKFVFELGGTGGPKLNVETADLVLPIAAYDRYGSSSLLKKSDLCMFGIQKWTTSSSSSSSSSYSSNLGSSLLRRSYIVVDLANQEIAVAPVKYPSGSKAPASDILAFGRYGDYTPGASEFCTSSYCPDSGSGSDSGSGPGSGSGSGGRYGLPDRESGMEHWEKVAIGVGVTFGVLILVGVIMGIILCTRSGRGKGIAKEIDEEGLEGEAPPAPPATSTNPEMSQNTRGSMVLPPGPLPSIQEGAESHAQTQASAPQPPALGTQLARPITPPEPTASANSNRLSVAVSALSEEQETQAHGSAPVTEAAAPSSPKGKGKAVDQGEN